jgi:uncharacterized membrane protein YkoI
MPSREVQMKKIFAIFATIALASFGVAAEAASSDSVIRQVGLAMPKARDVALHVRPGEVISEEIQTREGGSGMRYTFNINTGQATYEVGIDANTGVVLVNAVEPPREATVDS